MPIPVVISYAAAYLSLILTLGVLVRDRHSFVHRMFALGMFLFAAEELLRGMSYGAVLPAETIYWQKRVIAVSSIIPAVWLVFSLAYARVNADKLIARWTWVIVAIGLAPLTFLVIFRTSVSV